MTTDEKNTPEPTENRNLKEEYDAQVIEDEGDLNDIDSPIFHGPND